MPSQSEFPYVVYLHGTGKPATAGFRTAEDADEYVDAMRIMEADRDNVNLHPRKPTVKKEDCLPHAVIKDTTRPRRFQCPACERFCVDYELRENSICPNRGCTQQIDREYDEVLCD